MDELFLNTYIYNWLSERASKVLIQKDYLASEVIFLSKEPEHKKLLMGYYYVPSHSKFVKIKKLLQELLPEFVETHPCYKDLQDLLPSMKESFIRNFMIPGSEM
jgi:hypothetical protein